MKKYDSMQNNTELNSEIIVEPVYNSHEDVYADQSVAVELDVTVPPWSGEEEISFSFEPKLLVGILASKPLFTNYFSKRLRQPITTGGFVMLR